MDDHLMNAAQCQKLSQMQAFNPPIQPEISIKRVSNGYIVDTFPGGRTAQSLLGATYHGTTHIATDDDIIDLLKQMLPWPELKA